MKLSCMHMKAIYWRMDNLRAFACFAHVADARSFSRAAEKLGLAQPNLSTMIGRLEDRLGAPLFIRKRTPLELTAVGQRLLPLARDLARQAAALEDETRRVRRERGDGVVIAGHGSTADVPQREQLIEAFLKRHPGRSLHVLESSHADAVTALERGEVDFVLSLRPDKALHSAVLGRFPLRLLVPAEHQLARFEVVPLAALQGVEVLDWLGVPQAIYDDLLGPIAASGAILRPVVETSVRANIQAATRLRLPYPILDSFRRANVPDTMVVKAFAGTAPFAELRLLAARPPAGAAQRELWALAQRLAI